MHCRNQLDFQLVYTVLIATFLLSNVMKSYYVAVNNEQGKAPTITEFTRALRKARETGVEQQQRELGHTLIACRYVLVFTEDKCTHKQHVHVQGNRTKQQESPQDQSRIQWYALSFGKGLLAGPHHLISSTSSFCSSRDSLDAILCSLGECSNFCVHYLVSSGLVGIAVSKLLYKMVLSLLPLWERTHSIHPTSAAAL